MSYDELFTSELVGAIVNVRSTAADVATYVAAEEASDAVTVGSLAPALGGTLANMQGSVIISARQIASVVIDDSGDTIAHPQAALSPARPTTTTSLLTWPRRRSISGLTRPLR